MRTPWTSTSRTPTCCPRYTARLVKNVKIQPSPAWMRERLRNSGVRPINNIVDITNYVMLEYGQPMHAFDFSCVEGGHIIVRTAREGETIQTLDGNQRKLTAIHARASATRNKPVCVAGVMGGANSEIVGDTAMVLFESANFNGASVRRTAAALGMRTEASARYEKGLDPMNTMKAVQRACELVELLGAGEVVDGVMDVIAKDSAPVTVKLEPEKVNALLGTDVPEDEMRRILLLPGLRPGGRHHPGPLLARRRGALLRHRGGSGPVPRLQQHPRHPAMRRSDQRRAASTPPRRPRTGWAICCRSAGYNEIITYSFISPSYYDKIDLPQGLPPAGLPEDPEPPGRGYLHHAHHHPPLHAGDPGPELQLPQPVRTAL